MADKESSFSIVAKIKADLSEFKSSINGAINDLKGGAKNIPFKFSKPKNDPNNPDFPSGKIDEFGKKVEENSNKSKTFLGMLKDGFGSQTPSAVGKTYDAMDKLNRLLGTMFTMYAGKKLFDYTLGQGMQFEDYQAGFEALYKGDTARAQRKMTQLTQFAKTTPYEVPEVMSAGVTLESAGLDANRFLKTAGNLAAANKSRGTTIGYASEILKNAFSGNYGMAMEELRNQGIDPRNLAKYGVRFSASGSVASDSMTVMNAIEKAVQAQYGDQMGKQSKTASGMISNIKDSISGFGRMINEEFYNKFKSAIEGVMNLLDKMASNGTMKAMATSFASMLAPIIDGFKNLIEWIAKASETGQLASTFATISTIFQGVGYAIQGAVGAFRTIANVAGTVMSTLSKINGIFGGTSQSAGKLTNALWGLVSAFLAIKAASVIVIGLRTIAQTLIWIQEGIRGVNLALKLLQSTNIIGLIMTMVSALLFLALQIDGVKKTLGGFLDKIGAGKLAEFLGLKDGKSADDIKQEETPKFEIPEIPDTNPDLTNAPDETDPSKHKYADLENQFKVATEDMDINTQKRDLTNQTDLQNLQLQGVRKVDDRYSNTERSGLQSMYETYMQGVQKMSDIIKQAGDDVGARQTKVQAENKLLEYQQKANDILLQIENNTSEFKNASEHASLTDSNIGLKKDITMQEVEMKGMRSDTAGYWYRNREQLKNQMNDFYGKAQQFRAMIPTLTGDAQIEVENKALEYQKKANDILLQIKKNTDPRNGTFNLPEGMKAWTLFDERQQNGKSGAIVSGNNFLIQVKELVDQSSLNDMATKIQETIFETLNSSSRR